MNRGSLRHWLGFEKTTINMFKFDKIEISDEEFNNYQVQEDVDLEKIRISKGLPPDGYGHVRYIIGYQTEPGKIVPLYIKTPKDCLSSGVCQSREGSQLRMGFNVGSDGEWVEQYEKIFGTVGKLLDRKLVEPLYRLHRRWSRVVW